MLALLNGGFVKLRTLLDPFLLGSHWDSAGAVPGAEPCAAEEAQPLRGRLGPADRAGLPPNAPVQTPRRDESQRGAASGEASPFNGCPCGCLAQARGQWC